MVKLEERLAAMPAPKQPYVDGIAYKETWWSGEVKLDLYLPYAHAQAEGDISAPHPVYIHVHGGSWMFGNRKFARFTKPLIEQLRQAGIAVVSIDYRKLDKVGFHRMVDDALDSLQWLVDNAEQYHLDPANVVLHGPSAGGHLVLMMAFAEQLDELTVKLVIDEFGPADLLLMKQLRQESSDKLWRFFPSFRLRKVSPMEYVRTGLPPIYIIHGEFDEVVPLSQSEALVKALQAVNVEVEMDVIENGNHGLLNVDADIKSTLFDKKRDKIFQALGVRVLTN